MSTALRNTTATRFRVKSTVDLDRFKSLPNRDESHTHALAILRSMKERVLYAPIYVNEKEQVIDGQHRLSALKMLRKQQPERRVEANFIVFDNLGYDSNVVPLYNTNSTNWRIDNFISSHIARNNQDVKLANDFFEIAKGLSKGLAVYILKGNKSLKSVRDGSIKVTQDEFDEAVRFYEALSSFRDARFAKWNDFGFVKAFAHIFYKPGYDHKLMQKALKTKAKTLVQRRTVPDYERDLNFIYPATV